MPRTQRVSSRARLLLKTRPKRGALVRYGDRIAEVLGEARGERVMIRSLHTDGVERRSAVVDESEPNRGRPFPSI